MASNQNSYLREVRESQKVFSALVHAMEKSHKAVVDAIEGRKREEEKRVATLVKEIEQEIQELTKENTDPDPRIALKNDQDDDTIQDTVVITCTFCRQCHGIGDWLISVKTVFLSRRTLLPRCAPLR